MSIIAKPKDKNLYKVDLLGTDFGPVDFFRLPFDVKMAANGFKDTSNPASLQLGGSGENVASMVDYMLRRNRDRFSAMENEAKDLIPGLKSLSISTPNPQTKKTFFSIGGICCSFSCDSSQTLNHCNLRTGMRCLLTLSCLLHFVFYQVVKLLFTE